MAEARVAMSRRHLLALLGVQPLWAVALPAAYPTKPVRLIVPNAPGSSIDTIGRLVGNQLAPVVDTLRQALAAGLQEPALRESFDGHGAVPTTSTPHEFRAYLVRDIEVNRRAIRAAGVQPE